jgi:hypothetical protein
MISNLVLALQGENMELNGWQKTWIIISSIWALLCVLLGALTGAFLPSLVVAAAPPALLYVIGLFLRNKLGIRLCAPRVYRFDND